MRNDRQILISAIKAALEAFELSNRGKTLLGRYPPDENVWKPLAVAIASCECFQSVQGQSVFSGLAGFVLHADSLALPLLYRADNHPDRSIASAADWLLKLLTTTRADAVFAAAIWGISVDQEVDFDGAFKLVPFHQLPNTPLKRHFQRRVRKDSGGYIWASSAYFDEPTAALIRKVVDFPYLGMLEKSLELYSLFGGNARDILYFLQAYSARQPLVALCWFEYEDQDLDINIHETYPDWIKPEIEPAIKSVIDIHADELQSAAIRFWRLDVQKQKLLIRSMQRFALSQCRYEIGDRALDLVIAFEILLSGGKGDNAPANWKVGVRAAQLIGGPLDRRQAIRKALATLYEIRSRNVHGGTLNGDKRANYGRMLDECSWIYPKLVEALTELDASPDWSALELEPRTRE